MDDITFICLVFRHANVFKNVVEYCRVYDIEKLHNLLTAGLNPDKNFNVYFMLTFI